MTLSEALCTALTGGDVNTGQREPVAFVPRQREPVHEEMPLADAFAFCFGGVTRDGKSLIS